ncbi:MAG: lysine-sensitive aspartokinase 3 [Oligoflexia bacterium]|nr:lysine-sensitive aspartokinase 3 [Oligoflexia bacterium]
MRIHVAKFGGTSMGDASSMRKAASIAKQDPHSCLVVVSAVSGTTNQLLAAINSITSKNQEAFADIIGGIEKRHREIASALHLNQQDLSILECYFLELREAFFSRDLLEEKNIDHILSFGEKFSSFLFSSALREEKLDVICVDSKILLATDSNFGKAEPNIQETKERCSVNALPLLENKKIIVTQGFIGSDKNGETTTLGRGGSDYSAALFAEALSACECKIWTDVNGIYSTDPRIENNAKVITNITFDEAAELAAFGAKVLHPATLYPAIRSGIKVFVGNTFDPENGGTWIHKELEILPQFRAVAIRKNQTLITVSSINMLNASGFLAKLFTTLANHGLSVDLVTTSEVTVALTIDGASLSSSGKSVLQNKELISELEKIADVQIEEDLSLVALIGNKLTTTPKIGARAFTSLKNTNVRLICHGASQHNICFLVPTSECETVAKYLHGEFI